MKAFLDDPKLKTAMLKQLTWHAKQDKIVKGSYGDQCTNGDFRGCAVGCSIHSLARIQGRKLNSADHTLFETELGIPANIAWLIDGLFEALPKDDALAFPRRVIAAIRPGADLSMIIPRFLLWMLSDPKIGSITGVKYDETRKFVEAVITLFDEWVKTGTRPSEDSSLTRAAWDARDAWAAWAARAAWDRRDARTKAAAGKLITLLEAA